MDTNVWSQNVEKEKRFITLPSYLQQNTQNFY